MCVNIGAVFYVIHLVIVGTIIFKIFTLGGNSKQGKIVEIMTNARKTLYSTISFLKEYSMQYRYIIGII